VAIGLFSYDWTYYSPDSNAVFLFTGCLLATLVRSVRSAQRLEVPFPVAAGALAIVCLAPLVLTRIPETDWRPATLLMVPVVLVSGPLVLGAARLKVLENPVLRWFGTVSYGVYLWNWVLISLEPHGRQLSGKERGLAGLLAIVAAAGSWYLFERPILKLKSRFQRVAELPVAAVAAPAEPGPDFAGPVPAVTATSETVPIALPSPGFRPRGRHTY
jgi:peptidoglycan/LPS O-acetylase OafA/YrhL